MPARRSAVTAVLVGALMMASAVTALPLVGGAAGAATKAGSSPTSGGTLVFGEVAGITSLDPIHIAGGGTSGGDEGGAVYGYLMRYDSPTGKYVPYLAKGLTHNADDTQWTLSLRPGMTFSDGTPFDAQAVTENFQRDMDPANHATAAGLLSLVKSVSAANATTVDFTLTEPWAGFAYTLAYTPGLIAAPSYIAKVEAGDTAATPIGAGPFTVSSFQAGSQLTLAANPNFVLGKPRLKTLKFTFVPGGPATLQAFQSGQLQSALLIDPPSVAQAKTDGIPALTSSFDLSTVLLMNNRSTSPLSNPKLREAVTLAFSPSVYNERVNQGAGPPPTRSSPRGPSGTAPTRRPPPTT